MVFLFFQQVKRQLAGKDLLLLQSFYILQTFTINLQKA